MPVKLQDYDNEESPTLPISEPIELTVSSWSEQGTEIRFHKLKQPEALLDREFYQPVALINYK